MASFQLFSSRWCKSVCSRRKPGVHYALRVGRFLIHAPHCHRHLSPRAQQCEDKVTPVSYQLLAPTEMHAQGVNTNSCQLQNPHGTAASKQKQPYLFTCPLQLQSVTSFFNACTSNMCVLRSHSIMSIQPGGIMQEVAEQHTNTRATLTLCCKACIPPTC